MKHEGKSDRGRAYFRRSGSSGAFLAWAKDYVDRLRRSLSADALERKLERTDLMNDEAVISSWQKADD